MNRSEKIYRNKLEKDIFIDLMGLIQFGLNNKISDFIEKVFMIIYEYTKFIRQYKTKFDDDSVHLTRKDIGTKLGQIIDRWALVDNNLAMQLMGSVSVGGDLNLVIDCWQKFMYELKLYLIANDDSEEIWRTAHYEIHSIEYPLMEKYVEENDIDLPGIDEVMDIRLQVENAEIHQAVEQVKELLAKQSKGEYEL